MSNKEALISETKYTEQYIANRSFDEKYSQAAKEILVENTEENGLIRQKEIATEKTMQELAGKDYDTQEIDTTDPDTIIVTYKKDNVVIRTETISIGDIISIIKT